MTNTPNLALPYPELTDTADVPRDIKALADKLDALLGGGGGGGGTGTVPLAAAPVLNVGQVGQIRAGRQLTVADFTSLGLTAPIGLWNLSNLTNLGTDGRPLVNLGSVPFDTGINGLATTSARFSGSTGQALYTVDSGAADPFRIRTGSWGCWFRTAKRGAFQAMLSKAGAAFTGATVNWNLQVGNGNTIVSHVSDGSTLSLVSGVSDVADDRWHFAVITADATLVRCYVDGVLEGTLQSTMAPAGAPLNIGGRSADGSTATSDPYFGRVDEAFVTGDALSEDQIRLLYAVRLSHTLGTIPTAARLAVHRRRKGAALAVADFVTQPIRLHNFTAGALTDQGSGGVALTNNGAAVSVAGADGTPGGAFSFAGAQSLSATDTGLPGGLTPRSYGCWVKWVVSAGLNFAFMAWGLAPNTSRILGLSTGQCRFDNGADTVAGPYTADGQWHQYIVVEDNTASDLVKRKCYIDGRLVGGSTTLNSITLGGATQPRFRVGADSDGTTPTIGQIDAAFVTGYAMTTQEILGLYAKGSQDLGASPKNAGDHVERLDAASVLAIFDTLESQHTVDLGVVA